MGNVIAPEELKTELVVLNDNELNMSKLGNFEEYKAYVQKTVDSVKGIKLTDTNLSEVKAVKSLIVSLRTDTVKKQKDWINSNINIRKNIALAAFESILSVIAEGEKQIDDELNKYEEERKAGLLYMFETYIAEQNEIFKLDEKNLERIEIKSNYFNVTKKEADVFNDITSQFVAIKKELDEREEAETAIKKECEGSTLNADVYIEMLSFKTPLSILSQIKEEKERVARLEEEKIAKAVAEKEAEIEKEVVERLTEKENVIEPEFNAVKEFEEEIIADKVVVNRLDSVVTDETKTLSVKLTYKASQARMINDFFKNNNIKVDVL